MADTTEIELTRPGSVPYKMRAEDSGQFAGWNGVQPDFKTGRAVRCWQMALRFQGSWKGFLLESQRSAKGGSIALRAKDKVKFYFWPRSSEILELRKIIETFDLR